MTLMAIGKTPDVWAAAVEEYGIINWLTMLEHEDPRLQQYEKSLLGDPVKDRKIYEADSPITYIRNERAPLLGRAGRLYSQAGRPDCGSALLPQRGTRLHKARERDRCNATHAGVVQSVSEGRFAADGQ